MGLRRFAFLVLFVFIMIGLSGCSGSSGSSSVGEKPITPTPGPGPSPSPTPGPIPPGAGYEFYLKPPFSSPGDGSSPGFIVRNLPDTSVTVSLYRGLVSSSECEDTDLIPIGTPVVTGASQNEITFENLGNIFNGVQDGTYKFFAKIEGEGISTACVEQTYVLDATKPEIIDRIFPGGITSIGNDDTPRKSKTWLWGCRDATSCEYRYLVDDTPMTGTDCASHTFLSSDAYSDVFVTTKTGGNGKYCIHIQARDEAGNESDVISVYATLDNTAPTILSVTVPSKTYTGGDRMDFTVTFSEPVKVTGTPRIPLTFNSGGSSPYAEYYQGSGSTSLTFRYEIKYIDMDNDGIGMTNSIDPNSGTLGDEAGNSVSPLTFTLPTNLSSVLVNGSDPNVVLSATNLSVGEDGGTITYTVRLNSEPTASVTIHITSNDTEVATVSPLGLTFETDDTNGKIWSSPKTVTLTGVNDDIDNDVGTHPQRMTNISHTVTSDDTDYSSLSVNSVGVTSLDDDDIGFIQLTLSSNSIDEHDDNSPFPQADNTKSVTVTAKFQGSTSGGQANSDVRLSDNLTLSTSVGVGTAQVEDFNTVSDFDIFILSGDNDGIGVFNLTVIDDSIDDDNEILLVNASTSPGLTVNPATLIITDDDEAGVMVSRSSLSIMEGDEKSYTLKLESEPTGPVVVTVSSEDMGVATVSPSVLTFEANNDNGKLWSLPQTVIVTGVDNNIPTNANRLTKTTHAISGGGYDGLSVSEVSVTVIDRENRLAITRAHNILADNYDNYSVSGSCVSGGGSISVQVGSVTAVTANCGGNHWSVTGFDTSEIPNGPVTITATQRVGSDTSTDSVEVERCIASGDGHPDNPKWICSYSELKGIAKEHDSTDYYILGVDIDARESWSEGTDQCGAYNGTDIAETNPCSGWEPVGDPEGVMFFIGFDGRGHSIENLYIHSSKTYVGLFGNIGNMNTSVSDLHLKNVRIHSTATELTDVGAIVGDNYGNIEGSSVTGIVSAEGVNSDVGGLVGVIQGKILNSYTDVEVKAKASRGTTAGGLAGDLLGGGSFIMNSHSRGSVSIDGNSGKVGGLSGMLNSSDVYWSYSRSVVSGGGYSGGLVGDFDFVRYSTISHSYSLGRDSDDPIADVRTNSPFFQGLSLVFWDKDVSGKDTSQVTKGVIGLTTENMQVACTGEETEGICTLGDGYSFVRGHYPKLKKCTTCDPDAPVFSSDELVEGQ